MVPFVVEEMEEYSKNSHGYYDLKAHVVWATRYGRPELWGEEAIRVRELVRKTCKELEVHILAGNVRKDHVHLLLSYPPQLSLSRLVHRLKEDTSHKLLEESERLQKEFLEKRLWNRGYLAVSTGSTENVGDIIAEYIKNQDSIGKHTKSSLFYLKACTPKNSS